MSARRPRILAVLDFYLPGFKAGGPIRTMANIVDQLGDQFDFWIFTRDRDDGDTAPYRTVNLAAWNQVGEANVFYATPEFRQINNLQRVLEEVEPDLIYLNSFYSTFTVQVLRLRRRQKGRFPPTILAPRGEFAPAAMAVSALKKRAYRLYAHLTTLYEDVTWHVSSEHEARDLMNGWPSAQQVMIAPNLPAIPEPVSTPPVKRSGSVKLLYVGRIAPNKNLHFLLERLAVTRGEITVTICGPHDFPDYYATCEALIEKLPAHVTVNVTGAVPHKDINGYLRDHHFLVLPSKGENFGHAIYEALAAGRPVLVSNQTPWRQLPEADAGWDLDLESPSQWDVAIKTAVTMTAVEYKRYSEGARRYIDHWLATNPLRQSMIDLFNSALARR